MINDMGWTPESIPNFGHTAMLRCQFRAAVVQFNLQAEVEAQAERNQVEVGAVPREGAADTATDLQGPELQVSLDV